MSDEPAVRDYPQMITPFNHIEPVPRRIRGYLAGETVFDTVSARYVWEWAKYPQYYIPLADVDSAVLIDEDHPQRLSRGTARQHALQVGKTIRPAAARVYGADALPGLVDTVRFEWPPLTRGLKRTNRSTSTRVIRTPESMHCALLGRYGSSWTARCLPSPLHQ